MGMFSLLGLHWFTDNGRPSNSSRIIDSEHAPSLSVHVNPGPQFTEDADSQDLIWNVSVLRNILPNGAVGNISELDNSDV